jgi:hypothetical protein
LPPRNGGRCMSKVGGSRSSGCRNCCRGLDRIAFGPRRAQGYPRAGSPPEPIRVG